MWLVLLLVCCIGGLWVVIIWWVFDWVCIKVCGVIRLWIWCWVIGLFFFLWWILLVFFLINVFWVVWNNCVIFCWGGVGVVMRYVWCWCRGWGLFGVGCSWCGGFWLDVCVCSILLSFGGVGVICMMVGFF